MCVSKMLWLEKIVGGQRKMVYNILKVSAL